MHSRLWTLLGVLRTVAIVILSALISYSFGHSLGTTETNARIFGAVSVAAVGVRAVLALRISAHWDEGRWGGAVIGIAMFALLVAYAVATSIGFGMQNRSQLAGSGDSLSAQLKDKTAERDQAVSRLASLGENLPVAAITARLDAAKKDRRWPQTQECANATAAFSREFCQGIDRLLGQLEVAKTAAALRENIEKLNKSIEKLRADGAGQIGDAQSFGLAMIFRTGPETVRVGLSILLALVIESVCCFGLLVIVAGHASADGRTQAMAEWIGTWLSDRAEPGPEARVSFSELEKDFRMWGRSRKAPHIGTWKFRRLVRTACSELGLMTRGKNLLGLQLVSAGQVRYLR